MISDSSSVGKSFRDHRSEALRQRQALQGYQNTRKLSILGAHRSSNKLTVVMIRYIFAI
jgi:hypothetical protein